MNILLLFGFILALFVGIGNGQSCPEVPNVARVCTSGTYSGARVLMDASYFSEFVENCSCTFSTTADTIRIVTYTAPNFQQCNSAIRLFSESGNSMRFQCLMSGTYLDTSAYRTGGTEFETFGPEYDMNYCLVLEHLGTPTDTITISCNGLEEVPISTPSEAMNGTVNGLPETTTVDMLVTQRQLETIENRTFEDVGVVNITTQSTLDFNTNTDNETQIKDHNVSTVNETHGDSVHNFENAFTTTMPFGVELKNATNETLGANASIVMNTVAALKEPNNTEGSASFVFDGIPRDIITSDTITTESIKASDNAKLSTGTDSTLSNKANPMGIITFRNDTITTDRSNNPTTTVYPHMFGSDTVAIDNRSAVPDLILTFGDDTPVMDTVTSQPAALTTETRVPFGNDAIVKEVVEDSSLNETMRVTPDLNVSVINGSFDRDTVTAYPNVLSTWKTVTFGNDAIAKEVVTINPINDTITSSSDFRLTFGNDTLVKETPVNETKTVIPDLYLSFGNDAIERDNVTSQPVIMSTDNTVTLGDDAIVNATDRKLEFGIDAIVKEAITDSKRNETIDIAPASNVSLRNNEFESDNATSPSDGLVKEELIPFGNDAIAVVTDTTQTGITTDFDVMSFSNESQSNTLPSLSNKSENEINNWVSNDSYTDLTNDTVNTVVNSTLDTLPASGRDTFLNDHSTFGADAELRERVTFGQDAIPTNTTVSYHDLDPTDSRTHFGSDSIPKDIYPGSNHTVAESLLLQQNTMGNGKNITSDPNYDTTQHTQTFGFDALPRERTTDVPDSLSNPTTTMSDRSFSEETTVSPSVATSTFNVTSKIDLSSNSRWLETLKVKPLTRGITLRADEVTVQPNELSTEKNMTFGSDAIVKEGFTTRPSSEGTSIMPDVSLSFGGDARVSNKISLSSPNRTTFGSDAVPKEVLTNDPLNEQGSVMSGLDLSFGNDALPRETVTVLPDVMTTENRATFGNDVILKEVVANTPLNEQGNVMSGLDLLFGNDALPRETVTVLPDGMTTEKRATFGNDVILKEVVANTPLNEQGNVMSGLDVSFGNDAMPRETVTVLPDVMTTEKRATFGNDAIPKEVVTKDTQAQPISILNFTNSIDMTPTFGPDVVVPDNRSPLPDETLSLISGTQGMGIVTPQPAELSTDTFVSFGNDAIPKEVLTNTSLNDQANIMTDLTFSFGEDALGRDNVTSMSDVLPTEIRMPFGNDAISKEILTAGPVNETMDILPILNQSFGNDAIGLDIETVHTNVLPTEENATLWKDVIVDDLGSDIAPPQPDDISFGNDAILKETFTVNPRNNTETINFGTDAVLPDSIKSSVGVNTQEQIDNASSLINDTLVERQRIPFWNDVVLKEETTESPTFGVDVVTSRSDLGPAIDSLPFGHDIITRMPSEPTGPPSTENSFTFGNDAVPVRDSRVHSFSTSVQQNDNEARATINDVPTINITKDTAMTNTAATTIDSIIEEPVVEEIISKQSDSSLLSSVNQARSDISISLLDSILDTHNDTLSAFDANTTPSVSWNNESMNSTPERVTLGFDTVTRDKHRRPDNTSGDTFVSVNDGMNKHPIDVLIDHLTLDSPESTSVQSIIPDNEITTVHSEIVHEDKTKVPLGMDAIDRKSDITTLRITEGSTENTEVTISTPTTNMTSTETPSDPTTMESTETKSTLPDIIPGIQDTSDSTIPRNEILPIVNDVKTTQSPIRTTKKLYDVMVDEPVLTRDRTVIDDSSETRSSKDQLNVSFEDETDESLFDMNNKTYIVIVIAVAGFIVLVALIVVIVRNKRKSRTDKANINNGVTNHNNAAFENDVSEAERGTLPTNGNGADLPKPSVEVLEPTQVNGSDNNTTSGHL